MYKRFPLVLIGLLTLSFTNIYPQQPTVSPTTPPVLGAGMNYSASPEYYSVGDIKGNIGEARPILLPKPVFSDEAKEFGFDGRVRVEIVIDKSGIVTSAKAVSGNQALYKASEDAALKSKFSTTKISQKAESYAAYLIYEFNIKTPNWFKVGYELALFEKFPAIDYLSTGLIKKVFQPDWEAENELILQLADIKRTTPAPPKPMFVAQMIQNSRTSSSASQSITGKVYVPGNATQTRPNLISISQNLTSQLRGRLGNNTQNLWRFNLGFSVIEFSSLYRNPDTRADAVEFIKHIINKAPADTPSEFLAELQKLTNLPDKKPSPESGSYLRQIFANLQNIQ